MKAVFTSTIRIKILDMNKSFHLSICLARCNCRTYVSYIKEENNVLYLRADYNLTTSYFTLPFWFLFKSMFIQLDLVIKCLLLLNNYKTFVL